MAARNPRCGIGIPIQEAVVRAAMARSQREGREAQLWQLTIPALGDGLLSDAALERWIERDIDLTQKALASSRTGEWRLEGIRPGAIYPEFAPQAWLLRPVRLELRHETVEWNDVKFCGLFVYSAAFAGQKGQAQPTIRRPSKNQVRLRMERVAREWMKTRGEKIIRPEAILRCRGTFPSDLQPTARQLMQAFADLDPTLKRRPGEHI